ncbi:MAG: hypothetical protein ABIO70_27425 [Pseudomonadota bacterium]
MALRQQGLGRVAAFALLALGLGLPRGAVAAGRVLAVTVEDGLRDPASQRDLDPLLGSLGYRQVSWMGAAELEARVTLVSVVDLRADEACAGRVALSDWSHRLEGAQEAVQLLDARGALAALSALGLDVACLDWVPRQQDLVLMALTTAEAHALAAADASNIGQRLFHEGEQAVALATAASFGPDLPPPAWLSPTLRQGLLDAKAAGASGRGAPAVFGGSTRSLWLDGQHVTSGFRRLTPGPHLLQATASQEVVAARVLQVGADQRLLVEVSPGERARRPEDLVEALHDLAPGVEPDPIAVDLVTLLAEEADDCVIVGLGPKGPLVWGRGRGGLVQRERSGAPAPAEVGFEDVGEAPAPRQRPARLPPIPWTIGVGPGLLAGGYGEGDLEGLAGLSGGVGVDVRVSFARAFAAAASVQPVARAEALPPGYDAHWLWRALIPLRLGLRYGAPTARPGLEVGPDLGLLYFGRFDEMIELRPLGVLALGFHLPLAPSFGLRLEGWGGLGADTRAAGLRLSAVVHPAAVVEE